MVYPVAWTAVCYVTVITLFIKKVGGSGPPSGCALDPVYDCLGGIGTSQPLIGYEGLGSLWTF